MLRTGRFNKKLICEQLYSHFYWSYNPKVMWIVFDVPQILSQRSQCSSYSEIITANRVAKVIFQSCLPFCPREGVPCAHYTWCIWPHQPLDMFKLLQLGPNWTGSPLDIFIFLSWTLLYSELPPLDPASPLLPILTIEKKSSSKYPAPRRNSKTM